MNSDSGSRTSTSVGHTNGTGVTDLRTVHNRRTHGKWAALIVRSVFSPALVTPGRDVTDPLGHLGTQERAVLFTLVESAGKVVSRHELARRVGIADLSERRCDSLLVGVRRVLGPDAIRTVRSRGWMIEPDVAAVAVSMLDQAS